jgi:hypothetical protein
VVKAGQVYGVPLSGPLLGKSGLFPEQRTYREDSNGCFLPIVFELIDSIALSQSHVRMFVDISIRRLRELTPNGSVPDSKDHPREASIAIFFLSYFAT